MCFPDWRRRRRSQLCRELPRGDGGGHCPVAQQQILCARANQVPSSKLLKHLDLPCRDDFDRITYTWIIAHDLRDKSPSTRLSGLVIYDEENVCCHREWRRKLTYTHATTSRPIPGFPSRRFSDTEPMLNRHNACQLRRIENAKYRRTTIVADWVRGLVGKRSSRTPLRLLDALDAGRICTT